MATRFDIPIVVCVLLLSAIGLLAIYSASAQNPTPSPYNYFSRQLVWLGIGLIVGIMASIVSLKFIANISYGMYALTLLGLLLLLFTGRGSGSHRWLFLGPLQVQPSEFAKIGTLLALSSYLYSDKSDLSRFSVVLICFGIVALPMALILRQPDMGTALVFAGMILPLLFWAGLPSFTLFLIIAPLITILAAFNFYTFLIVIVAIVAVSYFSHHGKRILVANFLLNVAVGFLSPAIWNRLAPYQQKRILTFLGVVSDPQGIGYQVIQSKVAIGSGGVLGKGFMRGTQTQLRFLPEQHTDFIFSVIGEEFGFFGALLVLILFMIILLRGVRIAAAVRNRYTSLVVIGAVIILALHVLINVGVTLGIMPVTGLPLPFVSYGGSSLLTFSFLIGLIINGSIRKLEY